MELIHPARLGICADLFENEWAAGMQRGASIMLVRPCILANHRSITLSTLPSCCELLISQYDDGRVFMCCNGSFSVHVHTVG